MEFEAKIIYFLQAGMTQGWTTFFEIFSLFASWVGLIILFLIFYQINKTYGFTFLITYGFGVGVNYLLKLIISRDRPFETYSSIQALTNTFGKSMPSGHAVSAMIMVVFVCFTVFALAKTRFTKIATLVSSIIFIGIVCVSRMYLGVHYLTDIILGLFIGLIVGFIGIKTYEKLMTSVMKGN